jgi:Ca2+/Na+ antiporter
MKVFSLLIIGGIGFFVIKKYVDEYKDKPNPTHLILLLGLFVFFLATFLGHDLRSDMFVFLYAIALGAYYTSKSLKNKDEVVLIFGVILILGPLNVKIIEFFGTERLDQSSAGAIMVVIGGILATMVAIMRNQWKVTEKLTDSNSSAAKPEREELDQI